MTNRTIRSLAVGDVDYLQALDTEAHGQAWSRRVFVDEMTGDDRVHLVAETDGAVVGHVAAWIDGKSCRITNVAVARDHAGHGHASALLLAVFDRALARSSVMNAQLEVRPGNRRAQRLYSRFGFVPVGIERNFYDRRDDAGSTDALIMAVTDVCSTTWRDRLDRLASETNAGAAV